MLGNRKGTYILALLASVCTIDQGRAAEFAFSSYGLGGATLIGSTPLILGARYYEEFNAKHRMDGSTSFLSGTMRF